MPSCVRRPEEALEAAWVWGSQNYKTIITWRWQGCQPPPPENIPGAHFCWRLSRSQGDSAAGRIKSKENPNDPIGNETRAVAQTIAPPPTPLSWRLFLMFNNMDATGRAYLGTTFCSDVGNWYTVSVKDVYCSVQSDYKLAYILRDFKVLLPVLLKIRGLWDVTLCRLVNRPRRFESSTVIRNVVNCLPNDPAYLLRRIWCSNPLFICEILLYVTSIALITTSLPKFEVMSDESSTAGMCTNANYAEGMSSRSCNCYSCW